MDFPLNTAVLWDRVGVEAPRFLHAAAKIAPLVFFKADIHQLLSDTRANVGNNFSQSVSLMHKSSFYKRFHIASFPAYLLQSPGYCFVHSSSLGGVGGPGGSDVMLNVPVECEDLFRSPSKEERSPSMELMRNLAKTVTAGKGFSLKQFMRIQATGRVRPVDSDDAASEMSGKFHFLAAVPDLSFQVVAIRPVPLLTTPLSATVLTGSHGSSRDKPRMGFLSMNQTRKLVMLLPEDAAVSTARLVGVWVRFDPDQELFSSDIHQAREDALQHPLTWAAGVRFALSERVKQRVHVADDTFLIVVVLGDTVHCFEATSVRGAAPAPPGLPCGFLTVDFTADLSCELSVGRASPESVQEPVLCKFKPCARALTPAEAARCRTGPSLTDLSPVEKLTLRDLDGASSVGELSDLPVPRDVHCVPQPTSSPKRPAAPHPTRSMMIAPGAFSSLMTAAKLEQQQLSVPQAQAAGTAAVASIQSAPGLAMGVELHAMQYTFPADVIAAQQRQIEALQQQVSDLHALVAALTASPQTAGGVASWSTPQLSITSLGGGAVALPVASATELARSALSVATMEEVSQLELPSTLLFARDADSERASTDFSAAQSRGTTAGHSLTYSAAAPSLPSAPAHPSEALDRMLAQYEDDDLPLQESESILLIEARYRGAAHGRT